MAEDLERRREEEQRPLTEAGEGESEGFEEAEALLQQNAENAEHSSALDGFPEEEESDLSGAEYGEADEVEGADE